MEIGNHGGRVVLVTGASSGIGKSIASLLFERGYTVFGTSRKQQKHAHGYEMLELDVTSDRSVKSCISELISKAGHIDILVNNAGYVTTGALEETSISEAIAQFEANFFGAMRMTNEVLPIMRKHRHGQIINIGSLAGTIPVPFQGTYAMTKAAILLYSQQLRYELRDFGISVSVVEPGFINTGIMHNGIVAASLISEYGIKREKVVSKIAEELRKGADPKIIAKAVLKIVESKSPKLRYQIGKEKRYLLLKRMSPDTVFEKQAGDYWLKK